MPPKALPLSKEEIYENSKYTIISPRDLRALTKNKTFIECKSRNEQIVVMQEFLKINCSISANAKLLGEVFNISAGNVRKILCDFRKIKKEAGRPLALSVEQENILLNEIKSKEETGNYMTQSDIFSYIENNFKVSLTKGWLNNFIFRHSNAIQKTVVSPQESMRFQIPRCYLMEYIDLIEKIIGITPAKYIYNIDEVGLSDWEERKPKIVIIPNNLPQKQLHYPINRNLSHITLLVMINADGDAEIPLMISKEKNAEKIFEKGVRKDIDLKLKIQNSAYVTTESFKEYILEYFVPKFIQEKISDEKENLPAIIFLDNCKAHLDENLLKILAENKILVITYPPHTSHVFQVLDKLLFGVLKKHKKYIPKNDDWQPLVDHIYRTFHAYELSTCSTTIRSSFIKTGFEYFTKNNKLYLKLNKSKIQNSIEFQEIWNFNYSFNDMSMRRRSIKFGWVNREFFSQEFQTYIDNLFAK